MLHFMQQLRELALWVSVQWWWWPLILIVAFVGVLMIAKMAHPISNAFVLAVFSMV